MNIYTYRSKVCHKTQQTFYLTTTGGGRPLGPPGITPGGRLDTIACGGKP